MAEYVERKALRDVLYDEDAVTMRGVAIINGFPAADVAPVRHGKWIKDESAYYTDDYYCVYHDWHCGNCGETVSDRHGLPKYCPNCGARMDGEAYADD